MPSFTDQRQRLRTIVGNALADALYRGCLSEDGGRSLLLQLARPDGKRVFLRFRGVQRSQFDTEPPQDARLRLVAVGEGKFSLLRLFIPALLRPASSTSRVTIRAGDLRLDIVCEDAEWWVEEAPQTPSGGGMP